MPQTRFKILAFLPVLLILIWTGLITMIVSKLLGRPTTPPFGVFVFLAFAIFVNVWLIFGELRNKASRVRINGNQIYVSNFLGLGLTKVYDCSQFDGFTTTILPSKYSTYEYLFLIRNGKRIATLSEFYHANFTDIKNLLVDKIPNLGRMKYSLLRELKEVF